MNTKYKHIELLKTFELFKPSPPSFVYSLNLNYYNMKKIVTLLMAAGLFGFINTASAQDSARHHHQPPVLTPQELQHVKNAKESVDALSPKEKMALRHQLKNEARAKWDSLSPEKKLELKAKMKAKWESFSPEEKIALKETLKAEMKAKWDKMSPEKRRQMMRRMWEKRRGERRQEN